MPTYAQKIIACIRLQTSRHSSAPPLSTHKTGSKVREERSAHIVSSSEGNTSAPRYVSGCAPLSQRGSPREAGVYLAACCADHKHGHLENNVHLTILFSNDY